MREGHLSAQEVLAVLDVVQRHDAILIGGQSVNLWAEYYFAADPLLAKWGPYTSKDIDFYRNPEAAVGLKDALGGTLRIPPSMDDASPNAATVVAKLGNTRIEIDFLARVLGVDDAAIRNRYVTLEGLELQTGQTVRILLLHPLDCLRSRLSNLNVLRRRDEIALNQTHAIVVVLRCFIDDLLRSNARRNAQNILRDLYHVVLGDHVGRPSHVEHAVAPETVLRHFVEDERLDARWRALTLGPMIARLDHKLAAAAARRRP